MARGDFGKKYTMVTCYCVELMRSNLGTIVRVTVAIPGHYFKRVYMCLAACKEGFVGDCRQLISLDSCHLKDTVAS